MDHTPIIVEQIVHAPIDKVWQAISDKDQMKGWYFDLAEFKAEVGFEFQFTGGTEEKNYLHLCRVTEAAPNKNLSYSWRYEGYDGISFVTFELFPEGEHTRLRLTHTGLETFPASNPDFAKKNFEAGWADIIGNHLNEFVENRTGN